MRARRPGGVDLPPRALELRSPSTFTVVCLLPRARALAGPLAADPRLDEELTERCVDAREPLPLGQAAHRGAGDDHQVLPTLQLRLDTAKRFPQKPLHTVALDRPPNLARHREPQTR